MVKGNNHEGLVGADAVAVELTAISLLSLFAWRWNTYWEYDWVFLLAGVAAMAILWIRIMAGIAEDPDIELIRRSLQWSSRLLDLILIGALAALSIRISTEVGLLAPVTVFTAMAVVLSVGFALLDQRVLGEYGETWNRVIHEETGDGPIQRLLRESGDFGEEQLSVLGTDESPDPPAKGLRGLMLGVGLFLLLLLVGLPVWLVLWVVFGTWKAAVMVLFSLLFLRDSTRYIYIRYGAASGLSELRLKLRWEFVWSAAKGIIIALTLGYQLSL